MRSRAAAERFLRLLVSSKTYRPNGAVETTRDLAVWTLAHRGYSGGGRLDVWVYPTRDRAMRAGAELAMRSGLEEDEAACAAFAAGRYQQVLERYQQLRPQWHVLRVQAAFLQDDGDPGVPAPGLDGEATGPGEVIDNELDDGAVARIGPPPDRAGVSTVGTAPVGLADPMRRAVVAALETAGWPVEVEHHPQGGALRSYAGPAAVDVARDGDQPEALTGEEHPDDASVFNLSAPLRVRISAPMFANVAPELGRVAGIDGYEISTDRTAEQIVAEIDKAVGAARHRDMQDAAAHATCGICGDRYPDGALFTSTDASVPVCPCCPFDGDLLGAAPAYLAYQLDRDWSQSVARPAGWSAVGVLLCCLAGGDFGDRLHAEWRAHGTLFEPAEVWSDPASTWIWLPDAAHRPSALADLGCGASLAAVMAAVEDSHPDLIERYQALRDRQIAEYTAAEDDVDAPADNQGDGPEPRATIVRLWPAVIAYAVAMLTQQAERPDRRDPWHVLESFELADWIDSLDPQLNCRQVETVLREGIRVVRDALQSARAR